MKKIILIIFLSLFFTSCGSATIEEINQNKGFEKKETIIKVSDKTVKQYKDNSGGIKSIYLIFTDKGTYQIKDSILNLQFNSSDIYGYISKDKCYSVGIDMLSFRIGLFSMYENITSAKEIDCE